MRRIAAWAALWWIPARPALWGAKSPWPLRLWGKPWRPAKGLPGWRRSWWPAEGLPGWRCAKLVGRRKRVLWRPACRWSELIGRCAKLVGWPKWVLWWATGLSRLKRRLRRSARHGRRLREGWRHIAAKAGVSGRAAKGRGRLPKAGVSGRAAEAWGGLPKAARRGLWRGGKLILAPGGRVGKQFKAEFYPARTTHANQIIRGQGARLIWSEPDPVDGGSVAAAQVHNLVLPAADRANLRVAAGDLIVGQGQAIIPAAAYGDWLSSQGKGPAIWFTYHCTHTMPLLCRM